MVGPDVCFVICRCVFQPQVNNPMLRLLRSSGRSGLFKASPASLRVIAQRFEHSEATTPVAETETKLKQQQTPPAPPQTTWQTLVVGEIVRLKPHPTADRLNICHVNVGDSENLLQIICGAPNVQQGARVPVATVGTRLALKEPSTGDMYVFGS